MAEVTVEKIFGQYHVKVGDNVVGYIDRSPMNPKLWYMEIKGHPAEGSNSVAYLKGRAKTLLEADNGK